MLGVARSLARRAPPVRCGLARRQTDHAAQKATDQAARKAKVEKAFEEAASQNSPMFGSSSITLKSPMLYIMIGCTCAIFFASEYFEERAAAEEDRKLREAEAQKQAQPASLFPTLRR
ncbi:hypothetical protein M885DRAFT_617556 [Pelagophyceae sp. CCMP2097]|nr:hypothetical protein M885DRAFT_617556 [Pelagophyceae sp. CCMP2097]